MHINEFKKLKKKNEKSSAAIEMTQILSDLSANDENRTITMVLSDNSVDRMMDTINPKGWQLKNYMKNPVVLWSHGQDDLPIGKMIDLKVENNKLIGTIEFVKADIPVIGEKAEAVYQLLKNGFLNACSVGFYPIEAVFAEDEDRLGGMDFLKQELTELSIVSIPCNPNALVIDDTPKSFKSRVREAELLSIIHEIENKDK